MAQAQFDFSHLNVEERLRLAEELWDSVAETPERLALTDAQRQELDRRLDHIERDGPNGIPWDQVLDRLRSRTQ
jgi:putative addiction module component (TIGR02574 family)